MEPLRALTDEWIAIDPEMPPAHRVGASRGAGMPPVIIAALGALGAAALVKLLARESRRVNEELGTLRRQAGDPEPEAVRPTLRRDPHTGEYRPREP